MEIFENLWAHEDLKDFFPLLQLPDEIIMEILSHIPLLTLFKIGQISRRMYELSQSDYLWRRRTELFFSGSLNPYPMSWKQHYIYLLINTFQRTYLLQYDNLSCEIQCNPFISSLEGLIWDISIRLGHLEEFYVYFYLDTKYLSLIIYCHLGLDQYEVQLIGCSFPQGINWLQIKYLVVVDYSLRTYMESLVTKYTYPHRGCSLHNGIVERPSFTIPRNRTLTPQEIRGALLTLSSPFTREHLNLY